MTAPGTTPVEDRLVNLLAATARGPKRDGLYALWLTVRTAEGLLPPAPVSAKNHRRRLQTLGARLGSLALAAPLKRALVAAREHLASVLSQLVAPAGEVLGAEAGDAVATAARAARTLVA
jgi:hypothetical protein